MTGSAKTLLEVKDLKMHFPIYGGILKRQVGQVHAVDGVTFDVKEGETLGLVGESGCGKSTLGRAILRLYNPTSGQVVFNGHDITNMAPAELRPIRKDLQVIFQDPYDCLNSRHTVGKIIEEPLLIHGVGTPQSRKEKVQYLMDKVGLQPDAYDRYPHEFSGGQRQRIGIARAIALEPKLVICDEPVSALDVSIQSQVMNLMMDLQKEMGLAYIFIAHDLAVVRHISDRVAVMYLGRIVEFTDADSIYENPLHPYTKALISAIPEPDPTIKKKRIMLKGDVPSPINPPSGCTFHTRCPYVTDKCKTEVPQLKKYNIKDGREHYASCHYAGELD
ncbi:MAG: dipeptide ABC transporter ATP-binding protein [Lentisphaeraceae bacterium]|nr:dipeptide ABC transporter ATP-binding protein [Lentisphaeraceae bacterium]